VANQVKRRPNGQLEKGQVLNSHGRGKTPPEVKEVLCLTRAEIAKTISELWGLPVEELRRISLITQGAPAGKVLMARVLFLAAQKGDQSRMDSILNRAIGKPKEEVVVDVEGQIGISAEVRGMSDDALRDVVRSAVRSLKDVTKLE
jgi:hypothetical protein